MCVQHCVLNVFFHCILLRQLASWEALRRRQRVLELLNQQEKLKHDFTIAKNILLVQPESWSFDCTFLA